MVLMKLRQLLALQAIADTGSLQAAAVQLALTQPAVSRAIMELENELGIALLLRTSKGTSLTKAGTNVLNRARLIDREVRRIHEEAEVARGAFNGRLVVGVSPPAATAAFAETITSFVNARPDVQLNVIELRPQQIIAGLREGSVDVAMFSMFGDDAASPYFDTELAYELNTTLAVSSRHVGGERVGVPDLQAMPWLVLDTVLDKHSFLPSLFGAHGLALPGRILKCSSINMYAELAKQLDVVSMWTDAGLHILEPRINAGIMKRLVVDEGTPRAKMYLAYPDLDLMTAIAQDFLGWLRTALRRTGPTPGLTIGG